MKDPWAVGAARAIMTATIVRSGTIRLRSEEQRGDDEPEGAVEDEPGDRFC
jgi:hypothetical protein